MVGTGDRDIQSCVSTEASDRLLLLFRKPLSPRFKVHPNFKGEAAELKTEQCRSDKMR